MEILVSKKIIIALIFLAAISFYISYTFNTCLVSSIAKALPKWRHHPVVPTNTNPNNKNPIVHYRTSVRVVPLIGLGLIQGTNTNETDLSPKYKLFREQNLQPIRQLPSALIIGVKKGGTRALLEFIRIHPDVRAAGNEIHFFDKNYLKGYQWYRERLPPTLEGQLTIEKTPSYFITKEVPKRVQHMNPSIKLLIVVRDPVTRAISDYTQAISKKPEMKSFEELVFVNNSFNDWGGGSNIGRVNSETLRVNTETGPINHMGNLGKSEDGRIESETRRVASEIGRDPMSPNGVDGKIIDTSWGPIKLGIYSRYLLRWLKYFPLSQFLFVSGERLIIDPAIELKRVQDFLGLKYVVNEKHFYFNSTKGFPCLFKSEGHSTPHCLGKTKGRNHPRIDPIIIQRLRDFYRPFNNRFYQMTGINFGWA